MATPKPAPTESSPRRSQRVIHFLTQEELKRLLAVIKTKRDRTVFLLAYRHGLRASEIGLLQRTDVDLKQGRLTVHRLKGSLSAIYPLQPDMQKLVRSYLRTRTDDSPYLFLSNRGVPIDRRTLWYLMDRYAEKAGLPAEKHKFHIPSDLVVDQWVSNVESSSPRDFLLLHDLWTTFRHLLWPQITSVISTAWDFTTKSGGIWNFLIAREVTRLYRCKRSHQYVQVFAGSALSLGSRSSSGLHEKWPGWFMPGLCRREPTWS